MATNKVTFPKRRADGSANVDVVMVVSGMSGEQVVKRLSAWLPSWFAAAPNYTLLGQEFDPTVALSAVPQVSTDPRGVALRLSLRDPSHKLWKDWFVHELFPAMRREIPDLVLRSFESPTE